MMERSALLLLIITATLAEEDLGGKVFLFPRASASAHVVLSPGIKKPLQQVSVCLRSYTELRRGHTLFSLATPGSGNHNTILIFPESADHYLLCVGNQHETVQTDPGTLDWKHSCVTWDSGSGVTQLWVNGKPYPRRVLEKGFSIGVDTSIILGQDQDSYGGGFDVDDSFVGEIGDIHMWDYALSPEEIRKVMYGDLQGNLLNWNSLRYQIKGEVLVVPTLQGKSWGSN